MQGLTASAAARNIAHPSPKTTLTIRSRGALALGALSAGVTLKVLLAGVGAIADITTDHLVTITVLATTIAAGHMLLPQVKQFRVFPALGLAVLLLASTFYVVTSSAARNAEVEAVKVGDIRAANEARARVQDKLDFANARLEVARKDADAADADAKKECASGKGKKCDGARASSGDAKTKVGDIENSIALLEAEMRLMKAPREENAGLKHAARVFASLPFVDLDAEAIAARLELWWPFVKTLVLELGTIVFLGLGLGHSDAKPLQPAMPAPTAPGPTRKCRRGATTRDPKVVQFVSEFRKRHGRAPSIPEVKGAFPSMPKSTAWSYAKAG